MLWRKLDRVLKYHRPDGAWARRRLDRLAADLHQHLGMVFHRFITGEATQTPAIKLLVNGRLVKPWDPFARSEPEVVALPARSVTLPDARSRSVTVRPFVLPHRSAFSSPDAFDHHSGPRKWNRQQGFYVYRADRMIQSGGWSGLRAADEHTKFARVAIDFDPSADDFFQVNVAKMRISLPPEIRPSLQRSVTDVCREATSRYRRGQLAGQRDRQLPPNGHSTNATAGIAIWAAAVESDDEDALSRITSVLLDRNPGLVASLGW